MDLSMLLFAEGLKKGSSRRRLWRVQRNVQLNLAVQIRRRITAQPFDIGA